MLARCLTTILPAMTVPEDLETTRIHSVTGLTGGRTALVTARPCRAPHHTISDLGLIGGEQVPILGEVSLAHDGILFLDELPEFRRHVLEVMRQPLEEGSQEYNLPHIIDLTALAMLAERLNPPRDVRRTCSRSVGTYGHGWPALPPLASNVNWGVGMSGHVREPMPSSDPVVLLET
jgi:hypothetical protein